MRGASIYHLARGLFARKILSATDLANFAIAQGKFLTYGSENLSDMARITENALSFVTGRNVEEVTALSEEIYDEIMADKVWPGTVQLAHMHRAAGHQVWLVSAAPIELANIIATKLGLTGAIATVSEVEVARVPRGAGVRHGGGRPRRGERRRRAHDRRRRAPVQRARASSAARDGGEASPPAHRRVRRRSTDTVPRSHTIGTTFQTMARGRPSAPPGRSLRARARRSPFGRSRHRPR